MTPSDIQRQRDLTRLLRAQSAQAGQPPADGLESRIISRLPMRRPHRTPWIPLAVASAAALAIAVPMALLHWQVPANTDPTVAQQQPAPSPEPQPIDWNALLAAPRQRIDGEVMALRADGQHLVDLIKEAARPLKDAVDLTAR